MAPARSSRKSKQSLGLLVLHVCRNATLVLLLFSLLAALCIKLSGILEEAEEMSILRSLLTSTSSILPHNLFIKTEPEMQWSITQSFKSWHSKIYLNFLHYFDTIHDVFSLVYDYPMTPTLVVLMSSTVFVIIIISVYMLRMLWKRRGGSSYSKKMTVGVRPEKVMSLKSSEEQWWSATKIILVSILFLATIISIPWEFIRLYQNEVSKKASVTISGLPPQCLPQDMTLWGLLKSWLMWNFSWAQDPCEKYHQALLVDPVWEVTPVLVLSSAFTRCVTKPLEIFCSGLGQALRALFTEIPSPWQPVIMATIVFVSIMVIIMTCSYKVSVPMFFHIEPTKRTVVQTCSKHITTSSKNRSRGLTKTNHEGYSDLSEDSVGSLMDSSCETTF